MNLRFGEEEIQNIREELSWTHDPFVIPQDIYDSWNLHCLVKYYQICKGM